MDNYQMDLFYYQRMAYNYTFIKYKMTISIIHFNASQDENVKKVNVFLKDSLTNGEYHYHSKLQNLLFNYLY